MSILPFTPKAAPRIILDFGVVTHSDEFPSGSTVFWLEYRDGETVDTVWMGGCREAARDWQADGVCVIDLIERAAP